MFHQIRWTSEKIKQRLELIEPLVYWQRQTLSPFRYRKLAGPEVAPPVAADVDDGDWDTIPWNSYWGEYRANFMLRGSFQVPAGWDPKLATALYLPIGAAGDFSHPEALAYIDGQPYAACDRHHQEIILTPEHLDGREHCVALHGWAGSLRNTPEAKLLMRSCQLVQIDQATRDFVALARVALGTADALDDNHPSKAHLYNALDAAFLVLDTREPLSEGFYASISAAHAVLRNGIDQAGPPLEVDITAVGHGHIDVAWLWTLSQTRHKASRTFHNVLRLMEQYPHFHLTQSQPQLYEFVRQDFPALFQAIKKRIADGRWEPIGGMWVEADCNIPGGESLVRQFLLGRNYFREHFGSAAESPVLWLPDVFGYAWNLPQLIKEAGLEYFFTIKLGWSQYNRFPYDSFWWQGLDGTKVLTHFSPTKETTSAFASTYNAKATPQQVLSSWTNFQQKDWGRPGVTPPLLMSYGWGDGGGGPTREMLENLRELESFPAVPRTKTGTVNDFFQKLKDTAGDRLPTWNGELYLEYHRGTYTSQARNKRANRQSEFLLHNAEFLASMAAVLDETYSYPHADLRRAWELVCLNQFHDIIPGSSIKEVYQDSLEQYAEVKAIGTRVRDEALKAIGRHTGADLLLVNPNSFPRQDLAFWPNPAAPDTPMQHADGRPVFSQPVDGGILIDAGELPPYSVTPLSQSASPSGLSSSSEAPRHERGILSRESLRETPPPASPTLLENQFLRVEFNPAGDMVRIYDKEAGREVLPSGAIANQFQLFEDRPKTPDAWEIDINYDDRIWTAEPAESVRVVESGPLRATLEIRRQVFNSSIVQRIQLTHYSRRIDFVTSVAWRERQIMLKVAFPVKVLSPVATYEIQWGNVQRPTHRNTSWDWARFESCAQKWVDLSEGNYGVSLLNDCKYGHDIRDNVMRLTLLRSPSYPDPTADQGQHHFTYSLLPHSGRWDELTSAQAYALNNQTIVWANGQEKRQGTIHDTVSLLSVDLPNVIIETVKLAEDGRGLIVRLYESQRQRGQFTLSTAFPLAAAWRTNLLEEDQERLPVTDSGLQVSIRPYQILTLRLLPADHLK